MGIYGVVQLVIEMKENIAQYTTIGVERSSRIRKSLVVYAEGKPYSYF